MTSGDTVAMVRDPDLTTSFDASAIRGALQRDFALGDLSWFRAGGKVELMFQPADEADLVAFLKVLPAAVPVMVIGLGSNTLVREGGVEGVAIRLPMRGFGAVERISETRIRVGAAAPDKQVAKAALDLGLGGFAFYHGIPGGIGGALRMNAGANGSETAQRVVEVRAVDRQGEVHVFSNAEMGYAYRHCGAAHDLIFTSAVFEGVPAERAEIEAQMAAVADHRETAQPIRSKTGGSTFKNPPGHSAWKLIDAAGMRGHRIGGAHVSELHCNFLINDEGATPYEIELLGETVRARVLETSGIRLDWEIKRFGRFAPGREIEPFLGL